MLYSWSSVTFLTWGPPSEELPICFRSSIFPLSVWLIQFLRDVWGGLNIAAPTPDNDAKRMETKAWKANTVAVFPRTCLGRPGLGESKQQRACTSVEQKYISWSYSAFSGNIDKVNQTKRRVKNEPKSNERLSFVIQSLLEDSCVEKFLKSILCKKSFTLELLMLISTLLSVPAQSSLWQRHCLACSIDLMARGAEYPGKVNGAHLKWLLKTAGVQMYASLEK